MPIEESEGPGQFAGTRLLAPNPGFELRERNDQIQGGEIARGAVWASIAFTGSWKQSCQPAGCPQAARTSTSSAVRTVVGEFPIRRVDYWAAGRMVYQVYVLHSGSAPCLDKRKFTSLVSSVGD